MAQDLAPRHRLGRPQRTGQKVGLLELSKRQPHRRLTDRRPDFGTDPSLKVTEGRLSVTVVPDSHCRSIQAVCLFAVWIVNDDLILQLCRQ